MLGNYETCIKNGTNCTVHVYAYVNFVQFCIHNVTFRKMPNKNMSVGGGQHEDRQIGNQPF